jgi:subtilisin family serine protease
VRQRQFFILAVLTLVSFGALAKQDSNLLDGGNHAAIRLAGTADADASKVYIVQLRAPSAAEYHASFASKARRSGTAQRTRFDKTNVAIQSYSQRLGEEQLAVLNIAQPDSELIYSYRYGLNGFAARMRPSDAHKLANMPEVLQVWEDEIRPMATNYSLDFLDLFDQGVGLRSASGLDGEDVIIGVIDSGIYPEHPALTDTFIADRPRACLGSWAESSLMGLWLCARFKRLDDVLMFEPPSDWNGICEAGEDFEETSCNNKLIGARFFVDGANATGPIDAEELRSPRDVDGHGTHTATTAAGNRVKASVFGTFIGRVEGIAPRARVAVYKACWLRPGDQRASCNTSDLANAIDAAVADGVDIINYSVGSTQTRITSPDDIALMAATKAGILAVVAAGNEGPNYGTIGSPAGGPWVITAAASSRDGKTSLEALQIANPPAIAGKYAVKEANFTPSLEEVGPIEGALVLVDDEDDTLADGSSGTTSDGCEVLTNSDDVAGNIALIQRGGCSFDQKIINASDAGAVAVLVYNIAGDPIVMNGGTNLADIPALMIGQADGNLILAELDANATVTAIFDKTLFLTQDETGNVIGSFSGRGPAPVADILKPDVSAPGVNILAGFTPDAVNATPGESFAYLSGTSMSAPHITGVAALLRQAHPDWSPSALKSALMTTAHQSLLSSNGQNAAIPFDYGAGHIVPNDATDPGLVYDVTDDEFDSFACGTDSPAVSAERCDQLAAAGYSFAAADLNQPSIAVSRLANVRTISRRVTNVSDQSESYTASVIAPAGVEVSVAPASLTLAAGQSVSFEITLTHTSGALDLWRFGSLTWESNEHSVYSTIAVKPISLTAPAEVTTLGGSGSINFPVEFGYTGSYSAGVHGLNLPLITNGFVDDDPTKTFSFRTVNGVTAHLVDVPADQAYLRFSLFDSLTDGNDDLDLYVYFCADNVNCDKVGESGEPTSQEEFNILLPAAGRYAVLVHGFATDNASGGPGSNYQMLGWAFGLNDDKGNMTATGPAVVSAGTTENVTVTWSDLAPNTIYLGGVSHTTPDGLAAITVIRVGN